MSLVSSNENFKKIWRKFQIIANSLRKDEKNSYQMQKYALKI